MVSIHSDQEEQVDQHQDQDFVQAENAEDNGDGQEEQAGEDDKTQDQTCNGHACFSFFESMIVYMYDFQINKKYICTCSYQFLVCIFFQMTFCFGNYFFRVKF